MPTLPLPGPSGIKAILVHRAKQDLLDDGTLEDCGLSSAKKSRDLFEFEYEPFGESSRHKTPSDNEDVDENENAKDGVDVNDPKPSTSKNFLAEEKQILPTEFSIISKGQGFLAINACIEGVGYTGVLYSHNRNGMPGIFAKNEHEKFAQFCTRSKPNTPIDQWCSIAADRQLVPGRNGRFTKTNWAKKNGRMICYSCLCVVPAETSMPFACNCRERQKQRASRLKCGGYHPSRDRLVVVAQLENNNGTLHSINGIQNVMRTTAATCINSSIDGVEMDNEFQVAKVSGSGVNKSVDVLSIYNQSSRLRRNGKTPGSKSTLLKKRQGSLRGRRRSGSTVSTNQSALNLIEQNSKTASVALDVESNAIGTVSGSYILAAPDYAQQFSSLSREKLAEFSRPITCTIPDQLQFTYSAPSSICTGTGTAAVNDFSEESITNFKRKLRATSSAPTTRKILRGGGGRGRGKRHSSVSTASWNDHSSFTSLDECRSRFSERILMERAMRESLEMTRTIKTAHKSSFPSVKTRVVRNDSMAKSNKLEFEKNGKMNFDASTVDCDMTEGTSAAIALPTDATEKKRRIESNEAVTANLSFPKIPKLDLSVNTISDDVTAKAFESTSQYVIRNNSPLQMTIVKVSSMPFPTPNALPPKPEKTHHHRHRHHHHRHHRSRHHHHREHKGNDVNNVIVENKISSTNAPDSEKFIFNVGNNGCQGESNEVKNVNKVVKNEKPLSNKKSLLKINDYGLRSVTQTKTILAAALNGEDLDNFNNASISNGVKPLKDKRLSLEARISSIKERLMSGVSPTKPVPTCLLKAFKSRMSTCLPNNSPSKLSVRSENNNELSLSSSQHSNVSTHSSIVSASDFSETVLSSVSTLIRAELYRNTLTLADNKSCFAHGITSGSLVWARAPPSAYWPGLVIDVAANTVKVAWCGERTYNHVDVSTIGDFMGAFTTRFSPSSKEHRTNKKFCNAVAEAITLAQPSLSDLDRKLNTTVAKLLTSKFHWNLNGLTVFQGSRPIVIGGDTIDRTPDDSTAIEQYSDLKINGLSNSTVLDECSEAPLSESLSSDNFFNTETSVLDTTLMSVTMNDNTPLKMKTSGLDMGSPMATADIMVSQAARNAKAFALENNL